MRIYLCVLLVPGPALHLSHSYSEDQSKVHLRDLSLLWMHLVDVVPEIVPRLAHSLVCRRIVPPRQRDLAQRRSQRYESQRYALGSPYTTHEEFDGASGLTYEYGHDESHPHDTSTHRPNPIRARCATNERIRICPPATASSNEPQRYLTRPIVPLRLKTHIGSQVSYLVRLGGLGLWRLPHRRHRPRSRLACGPTPRLGNEGHGAHSVMSLFPAADRIPRTAGKASRIVSACS